MPVHQRLPAIDYIKAAAITAVVLTHAGPAPWEPHYALLDWNLRYSWTSFHIPAFLVVAGFLYQRPHSVSFRDIGVRLQRMLIPYLIASCIAQLAGFTAAQSWREAVYQLLTVSSFGIYWFIGVLAVCTLLVWPISRMTSEQCCGLLIVSFALACIFEVYGTRHAFEYIVGSFAGITLVQVSEKVYLFDYFLIGWVAACFFARWRSAFERNERLLLAITLLGIAGWLAATPVYETLTPFVNGARVLYSLCVITVLIVTTRRARVSPAIQFLSEATLGIYLYHIMFEFMVGPHVAAWPPALRIGVSFVVDLAGGVTVCLLARRLLGPRAHMLFGT